MMPKSVYITVIYCEDLGMTEWARLCTLALTFICIPWFAMLTFIISMPSSFTLVSL